MKLNYTKILLFFFPLNILLTSYHVYSKNKPYITSHHTQTNRSLCECDTQSTNYNNDEDIKSVKENFDRQTSQRLEEYNERMKVKRQKRKEERDKNIQEIIEKDRMNKSLSEKLEKGCLRCGCGLGGVAASVGIFGTVAVKELTKAAITTAMELAKEAAEKAGAAAAADAGKNAVIVGLQKLGVSTLGHKELGSYITSENYIDVSVIFGAINNQYEPWSCIFYLSGTRSGPVARETFCTWVTEQSKSVANIPEMLQGNSVSYTKVTEKAVETIVSDAKKAAAAAVKKATDEVIKNSTAAAESTYASCQIAIIASVIAIVVIALVMLIIYLILRYRRKQRMNKKQQYTKLLKE
ncbi:hypothetical protein PFTANZ_02719 [Plasmodium falciparum Tanzania (2000708)]|uniref:Surface antigen n=1 Tax=Plasmodium falciparum Tanzania (2000708) TaxID=1036725 RepID=A0A024W7V0_PLAFA|nr:hypothetical protein PFTANZ_02719 [Plasmodium falciparum Tanzania (2000708)]